MTVSVRLEGNSTPTPERKGENVADETLFTGSLAPDLGPRTDMACGRGKRAILRQTTVRERRIRPQHGRISWHAIRERKNGAITFEVAEAWKGVASGKIDVQISTMWIPIQQGEAYLVYAAEKNLVLAAHLCGRTALWELGRADTASFPAPSVTLKGSSSEPWSLTGIGTILALVVAVLLACFMIARRDPKQK